MPGRGMIVKGRRRPNQGGGLQLWLPNGSAPTTVKCPRCKGSGSEDGRIPCGVCRGDGAMERRALEQRVIDRCRIPAGIDPDGAQRVCGWPLFEGESRGRMMQHIRDCAARHHDSIVAQREQTHPEIMLPWDPELESWMKQHKDAVLEGRMRV